MKHLIRGAVLAVALAWTPMVFAQTAPGPKTAPPAEQKSEYGYMDLAFDVADFTDSVMQSIEKLMTTPDPKCGDFVGGFRDLEGKMAAIEQKITSGNFSGFEKVVITTVMASAKTAMAQLKSELIKRTCIEA